MSTARQPDSFEALVREYDHYIETIIIRISRGAVRHDDLPDLKQSVYLRVWQAMQPGSPSAYNPNRGAFTTYLYLLTRSVCVNQFTKNAKEPDNLALRMEVRAREHRRGSVAVEDIEALRDEQFEARVLTADVLARFRQYAETAEDGAQLLRFADACYRVTPTPRRLARELRQTTEETRALWRRATAVLTKLGAA